MSRLTHVVAATALGFTLHVGSVAAAEGEFDVVYSSTKFTEGEPLQIGQNRQHQMNLLELRTKDEGAFLGTTTAACHFNQDRDTASGAYLNTGWCAWRDKDGDLIFESWDGKAANADALLIGSGQLVGGTGKFAGINGTLSWRFDGELGRQRGFYDLPGK